MSEMAKKILKVYMVIKVAGLINTKKIASILGVSERSIQRYIKPLVEHGYVEPVRRGMKLYYRVVKPLSLSDVENIISGRYVSDADVYKLARTINNLIKESGLHADLVGASKIHMLVPTHSRITHDIDIVVAREHKQFLLTTLKYGIGLILEREGGLHADYRFSHPIHDIKVDVMVNGFREQGKLVWNLAPVLRRGELTLEHVVIAKLTRRSFREEADGYDVAVSLPHIDAERFAEIYRELKMENPELGKRVIKNLKIVRNYIEKEYHGEEALTYLQLLKNLMRKIGVKTSSSELVVVE